MKRDVISGRFLNERVCRISRQLNGKKMVIIYGTPSRSFRKRLADYGFRYDGNNKRWYKIMSKNQKLPAFIR